MLSINSFLIVFACSLLIRTLASSASDQGGAQDDVGSAQERNLTQENDTKTLKLSFMSATSAEGKLFAGAFFLALDYVNNNSSLLKGYKLDYFFNDTKGRSANAINAMTSHYGAGTVGFIGPDATCLCESTIADAWNLPMIGYVS